MRPPISDGGMVRASTKTAPGMLGDSENVPEEDGKVGVIVGHDDSSIPDGGTKDGRIVGFEQSGFGRGLYVHTGATPFRGARADVFIQQKLGLGHSLDLELARKGRLGSKFAQRHLVQMRCRIRERGIDLGG